MDTTAILQSLDCEIGNLQRARSILAGKSAKRRLTALKPKRVISPEGRRAIALGQKKRWAKQRAA